MIFARFALRDTLLIAAFTLLWVVASPLSAQSGPVADFLGLLAGVGVGVSVYLLHEWGHLIGALATSSKVAAGPTLWSRSLFSFDSQRNDRRQFLIMSAGGFVVTGAAFFGAYALLPEALLATRVARGAVCVLAFLAIFVEFPLVVWALVRSDLPPVEAFPLDESGREQARATAAGPCDSLPTGFDAGAEPVRTSPAA